MPDSTHRLTDPEAEKRRRRAITAFLHAGMHDQPSLALTVQALADARKSVALTTPGANPSTAGSPVSSDPRASRRTPPRWLSWNSRNTASRPPQTYVSL